MSKTKRFIMICAIVCAVGIAFSLAGIAAGGVKNLHKVSEHHSWFNFGPSYVNMDESTENVGDFTKIEAEGPMDIVVVAPGQEVESEGLMNKFLENVVIDSGLLSGDPGTVDVRWPKGKDKPEVKNDNGVLKIKVDKKYTNFVGFNFDIGDGDEDSDGAGSTVPVVIIHCTADQLDKIKIVDYCGDAFIIGAKSSDTDLNLDFGDIVILRGSGDELSLIISAGDIWIDSADYGKTTVKSDAGDTVISGCNGDISLKTDSGDVDISGCTGNIHAEANYGDISFKSSLPQDKFDISVKAEYGDVNIGGNTYEDPSKEITFKGGPNKITLTTDTGDINVKFKK